MASDKHEGVLWRYRLIDWSDNQWEYVVTPTSSPVAVAEYIAEYCDGLEDAWVTAIELVQRDAVVVQTRTLPV